MNVENKQEAIAKIKRMRGYSVYHYDIVEKCNLAISHLENGNLVGATKNIMLAKQPAFAEIEKMNKEIKELSKTFGIIESDIS